MGTATDKNDWSSAVVESLAQASSELGPVRAQAVQALADQKLPGQKSEEYRFTPILRTLEKLFPEWPGTPSQDSGLTDIKPFLVDGLETSVVVLLNGKYSESLSNIRETSIVLSALSDSNIDDVAFKLADFTKDPFVALNTASWTGGISISVPDNVQVSTPILFLNVTDSTADKVVTHSRLSVRIGANSSLSIVSRNICVGDNASFATLVEEVLVNEKARLDYCRIQNTSKEVSFTQTSIRQLSESHVNTFTLTLDGKLIRNNLTIAIDGERSESHFHGLYLLNGDTIADNHTVVDHKKPNSVSNELYKGVMDGNSKGVFNGKIFVRPDAQKTNAFQSNRNILLSEQATINTKPQLEIWADDVKCSHGCTTGQLDEEALFYLRSRGIPKDQAKAMLLYAFAAETFSFIENQVLRSHINTLVANRLNREI